MSSYLNPALKKCGIWFGVFCLTTVFFEISDNSKLIVKENKLFLL